MKKLNFLFALLAVFLFVSCAGKGQPEVIAEKFVEAMYTADFEKAKSYCTDDTKQTLDFLAAFAAEKKDEMKKADIQIEQKVVTIAEDGNSADVNVIVHGSLDLQTGEVIDSKEEKIHLVKVNEKWLVEYKLK